MLYLYLIKCSSRLFWLYTIFEIRFCLSCVGFGFRALLVVVYIGAIFDFKELVAERSSFFAKYTLGSIVWKLLGGYVLNVILLNICYPVNDNSRAGKTKRLHACARTTEWSPSPQNRHQNMHILSKTKRRTLTTKSISTTLAAIFVCLSTALSLSTLLSILKMWTFRAQVGVRYGTQKVW